VGNKTRIKVVKNKLAPPFREVELDIIFGKGFDRVADLLDRAVDAGLIEKSGNWYTLENDKVGPGRDKAVHALNEKPEMFDRLREKLMSLAIATPALGAEA